MRFTLSTEQRVFRDAVDGLLRDAGGVTAARAWAAGDTGPGLVVWRGLAGVGVQGLAVPEESGGSGFHFVEACCAVEQIGYHAAPGPYGESLAAAVYLADNGDPEGWLPRLADGDVVGTFAVPELSAGLPNADVAEVCLPAADIARAIRSLDPTRTLFPPLGTLPGESARSRDVAVMLTAAQLSGLGRAVLEMTVAYVKQRVQFGRPIGEYQAVKHRLAEAWTGVEFARHLPFAAALALMDDGSGSPGDATATAAASVSVSASASAALAACAEAAYEAARTALQLHGAIGYTDEYELSVYFKKIRALYSAWGNPSFHKARVLDAVRTG